MKHGPLKDILLAKSVAGYQNAPMEGHTRRQVTAMTDRLRLSGLIHCAKLGARTTWYFDTPEKAAQFVASKSAKVARLSKRSAFAAPNMRQMTIAKPKTRAGWGPEVEPVITSQTKVTIAPSPPRALWTNTYSEIG